MSAIKAAAIALLTALALATAAKAAERWETLPSFPPMPPAKASGMAPVNDIKMYYAEYGEGDPILFIHGGLGSADVWGNQVADFARDHRVIVADSRGHGRSTRSAQPFGYDLVLRGARERLAPIVMTALATGLALAPVVVAGNAPGHEIGQPMAVVILGGLVSSTLLNLFLVPALYLRFGARARVPAPTTEHANGHLDLGHGRLAPVTAAD